MKRRFRLTRSTDFKRVRRVGKSYAHPLLVLVAAGSTEPGFRIGFVAGQRVGGAVERNRAKRQMRAAAQNLQPRLKAGWDLILIARQPITTARFSEIESAMQSVLKRAGLLE